jgi:histidinol-phosphate aminotransferase
MASRAALVLALSAMDFEVLPSGANFIFAKHKTRDGAELTEKLRENSIVIRHFKKPARIAPYLRITIGTDAQSKQLLDALTKILK